MDLFQRTSLFDSGMQHLEVEGQWQKLFRMLVTGVVGLAWQTVEFWWMILIFWKNNSSLLVFLLLMQVVKRLHKPKLQRHCPQILSRCCQRIILLLFLLLYNQIFNYKKSAIVSSTTTKTKGYRTLIRKLIFLR